MADTRSGAVRQTLLVGALVVGTLDIADALIFFGLRGVAPIRIFQSIASGVLGKSAFTGGVAAGVLGLFLHFVIAALIVLVLYLVARQVPALVRQPLIAGPLYGLVVYLVMNRVVLPLSAASAGGHEATAVLVNGLLIHMLGVGLPAALCVRRALEWRA